MTLRVTVMTIGMCLRAAAQCAVSGTVVDGTTNGPVAKARVMAEVQGEYSFLRLADDQGRFCFEELTPAAYHLWVQKDGYPQERYGVKLVVEQGTVIPPVSLRITRAALIAGTVQDSEGEAVPGAQVTVYRGRGQKHEVMESVEDIAADRLGRFRFTDLKPGSYYLSAGPGELSDRRVMIPFAGSNGQFSRKKEVETFYSQSFTVADANAVVVGPGQQVRNLVLTLKRANMRRVTGRVINPPLSGFVSYSGETETHSGGPEMSGIIPIARDGAFAKLGLTPGKYRFWLKDGDRTVAGSDVDLTSGDALDIALNPIEAVDIPVTLRTEGKGPAARRDITLQREGSGEVWTLDAGADGSNRFKNVPRGVYRVDAAVTGQNLYLKKVAYGGEAQSTDRVDLRRAKSGALEFTFSPNVASIDGQVTQPDGSVQEVTVVLVNSDGIVARSGIDQKGQFRIGSIAPGQYRLFAITEFDEVAWEDSGLAQSLAGKFVELQLRENESRKVTVTPVSAAEWRAALARVHG